MNPSLSGAQYLLCALPDWASFAILNFLCIGVLFIIRDHYEKLPYNISVASQQGDFTLIIAVIIAAGILKRHHQVAWWMAGVFQGGLFLACLGVGIVMQIDAEKQARKKGRKMTFADIYHNFIILPGLLFFVFGTVIPVWFYGFVWERLLIVFLVAVWVVAFLFDAKTGRLDQPGWLAKHGIIVPIKRVR